MNISFEEISKKKGNELKKEVTKACKKFTFDMLMKEKETRKRAKI